MPRPAAGPAAKAPIAASATRARAPVPAPQAVQNIAASMARHGVRRIIAISTFGAGSTRPQVGWLARLLLFGLILRSQIADKKVMGRGLSKTNFEWTVVRRGL